MERDIVFKLNSNDKYRYDLINEDGNVIAVIHGDDLSDMGTETWIKDSEHPQGHYKPEIKARIIFEDE